MQKIINEAEFVIILEETSEELKHTMQLLENYPTLSEGATHKPWLKFQKQPKVHKKK